NSVLLETLQHLCVEPDLEVFAIEPLLAKPLDEVRERRHQQVEASEYSLRRQRARDLPGKQPARSSERVEVPCLEEPQIMEVDHLRVERLDLVKSDATKSGSPSQEARRAGERRSEERRVGKECRWRWGALRYK